MQRSHLNVETEMKTENSSTLNFQSTATDTDCLLRNIQRVCSHWHITAKDTDYCFVTAMRATESVLTDTVRQEIPTTVSLRSYVSQSLCLTCTMQKEKWFTVLLRLYVSQSLCLTYTVQKEKWFSVSLRSYVSQSLCLTYTMQKEKSFTVSLRSKTNKRLKERFLLDETGQNVQIFEESLFFKLRATIQQKTVKPTYLLSIWCQEALLYCCT